MFFTYLRRELGNRRRQTLIIAIGMALAIALVILVNAVSAGVRTAQASVLEGVYGVGTDITVSQASEPGAGGMGGPQFDFGTSEGTDESTDDAATTDDDGTTTLEQSQLQLDRGTASFDASALETVLGLDGVENATGVLTLANSTFSGELPQAPSTDSTDTTDGATTEGGAAPQGGMGGFGGGSFGIDQFTVTGIDPAADSVGPLTATTLDDGRLLTADDAGTNVAVLDATYATSEEFAVGDTVELGGEEFEVVGIVSSASADTSTASDAYVPLDVAQTLAGLEGQVSTISVQATDASVIDGVQADIEAALPDATVQTQSDLASTVSGSLSSASSLVAGLGTWLSILVLAAAFLIAVLFTISGVSRRTREFGTLKAIGWSNRRIVGQVAGETMVQGVIGGAIGIVVGLLGVLVVNLIGPTLTASAGSSTVLFGGGGGGMGGGTMPSGAPDAAAGGASGMGAALGDAASTASDVVLQAQITPAVILIAVGLAILGGVIAGAIGGWRASRLRPAEALRSVA